MRLQHTISHTAVQKTCHGLSTTFFQFTITKEDLSQNNARATQTVNCGTSTRKKKQKAQRNGVIAENITMSHGYGNIQQSRTEVRVPL